MKYPNIFVRISFSLIRNLAIAVQKIMKIKLEFDIILRKGPQWFSLTEKCVDYLLTKRYYVDLTFRHILCVDEIFVPSLLWNSPFRNAIYDKNNQFRSCMRKID